QLEVVAAVHGPVRLGESREQRALAAGKAGIVDQVHFREQRDRTHPPSGEECLDLAVAVHRLREGRRGADPPVTLQPDDLAGQLVAAADGEVRLAARVVELRGPAGQLEPELEATVR